MEYGICHLGTVPARAEASDKAEIVTHVLFGEHFKILEDITSDTGAGWLKIRLHHDQYEAWICKKQFMEITLQDYDNLSANEFPICGELFAHIEDVETGEQTPITLGATLPYFHQGKLKLRKKQFKYTGKIASPNDDLSTIAKSLLNTPYLWGGRGPTGIDCSGYSQLVYRLCGISLPRDAYQQAEIGDTIQFVDMVENGDLVFFDNAEGRINHVGIVLEPGKVIHASGKIRIDKLDHQGIYADDAQKYTHKLRIIKRVFGNFDR